MNKYNPLKSPDPSSWSVLDEEEQIILVEEYHRRQRVKLDNIRLHAVAHVTIENQAELGDETPVAETLDRLMSEGLDRHDALHAIGGVMMEHLWNIGRGDPGADPHEDYYQKLEQLTAESWLDKGA